MKKLGLASLGFLTMITLAGCSPEATTQNEAENQVSQTSETDTKAETKITEEMVNEAQQKWADGLVAIGKAYQEGNDYEEEASKMIDDRYGFQDGVVLFKPTKTSEENFRLTKEDALSYFVGGAHEEDEGCALAPWSNVRFENEATIIDSDSALASGLYYFTSAETGEETEVEYTFGYYLDSDGVLKIQLQHSSLPFEAK